ncbi:hypothetical protein O181_014288 [Austropuccinia psidii MF-1]|uniref:Uncharacterized protein n=1 Tax=Austropuccinia psidii MF-1 TaxID=1389203 RepID=A0A9Q3C098_9BASI|nr:hypothetical protein [Austropuccinia psidii MF-1]
MFNGRYNSGYKEGHRADQILEGRTGNVKISHHVQFFPDIFPHRLDHILETNNSPLSNLEPSSPVISSPKATPLEVETRVPEAVGNEISSEEEISTTK